MRLSKQIWNIKDNKSNFLLYLAFFLPILSGNGTTVANLISLIELIILLYYFNSDKFWVLMPIYYIYYTPLILIGSGIALYTVVSFIIIFKMFFFERYIKITGNKDIIVLLMLLLFSAVVLCFWTDIWSGFILAIQSLGMFYSVIKIRSNPRIKEDFKTSFILLTLSGSLYGIINQNIKGIYEEQITLIQYGGRYSGTTSDPNYMAFFYCISFCFLLFRKTKKTWLKRMGLVLLFFSTALTGSLTALITIVITAVLYIIFAKEYNWKTKMINVSLIFLATIGFIWFVFNPNIEIDFLDLYRLRILEKLQFIDVGNISDLTTGRTEYSGEYIKYLFDQNIMRILFGGYQLNSSALMGEAFETIHFAAHNSYIDILMTNGLCGLIIIIISMIGKLIKHIKKWWLNKDLEELSNAIYLLIVAVFMMGLSMFPSPVYMFFLFF